MKVNEMPDKAAKIGHSIFDFANKGAGQALVANNGGTGDGLFIVAMSALGSMVVGAPLIAKRPDGVTASSSVADQIKATVGMTNPETVLLVALVAARMFTECQVDQDEESYSTRSEFSPEVVHLALEDWKKLTGKDPASYLLESLVRKDREAFDGSEAKLLQDFLAKRPGSYVSPGSDAAQ